MFSFDKQRFIEETVARPDNCLHLIIITFPLPSIIHSSAWFEFPAITRCAYLQTWKSFLDCAWTWRPTFSDFAADLHCWPSTRTHPECHPASCHVLRSRSQRHPTRSRSRPCCVVPRCPVMTAKSWCHSWSAWNGTPSRMERWCALRTRGAYHASIDLDMFLHGINKTSAVINPFALWDVPCRVVPRSTWAASRWRHVTRVTLLSYWPMMWYETYTRFKIVFLGLRSDHTRVILKLPGIGEKGWKMVFFEVFVRIKA